VRRREDTPRHRDRLGQKSFGTAPVAVLEQDPAVIGAALRIQERAPVPVDETLKRLHPLCRALKIETAPAHHHRHAAHLRDRQRVTSLTANDTCHRLVQQRHAILDPALLHQGLPDRVHRHQFEVGVTARAPYLCRLARQHLALDRVVSDIGRRPEKFPPQLRNLIVNDPCRSRQPAPGRSRVPQVPLVVSHQRKSRPSREHKIPPPAEGNIGLFAIGDRAGDVAQPEQRARQPEEHLGYLGHLKGSGKSATRPTPVPGRHGVKPRAHQSPGRSRPNARILAHPSIFSDCQAANTRGFAPIPVYRESGEQALSSPHS
jgi:hypothetical protein